MKSNTKAQQWKYGILLLAALVCMTGLFGCAKAAEIETMEFDFFETSNYGLPLGWSVVSFEEKYEANTDNGVVTLSTDIADDVRLTHTFPVTGGKKYVLSADVATENVKDGQGATLSIDNYSIDGSYIYSKPLFGTNAFTRVELAFETDADQETVVLALRLGGYSNVSSGSVSFQNVKLSQTDSASVSFQKLTARSQSEKSESTKTDGEYEGFFSLLFWMTVLVAAVLLYGIYRNRQTLESRSMPEGMLAVWFTVLVLIGLIVRVFLCAVFKGHATDMGCWVGWGNQIADGNLGTFYDGTWYDYPPGYMLVLGGLTWIMRLLRVSQWGSETLRLFFYMLPAFLADIGCGILILRFVKEQGKSDALALLLSGLVVLNPAAVYLSGAWGQIDSILTLLLLLTFSAFRKDRRILAGVYYALAILVKWQALIYGPVLALLYVLTIRTEPDGKTAGNKILRTALAVVTALLIIFAVSLPFRGNMGIFWIVPRFLSASSGYDYATVEGYNFFALLGANWHQATLDVFEGAGVLQALLKTLTALMKVVVPVGLTALLSGAVSDFQASRSVWTLISLGTALLLMAICAVLLYAFPRLESFSWMLYGIAVLVGLAGWISQYLEQTPSFRAVLKEHEEISLPLLGIGIFAAVLSLMFTLWLTLRIFGIDLSYKLFGSLMIFIGCLALLGMLLLYRKAGRLTERDPEVIYLASAAFMLWVFTFGQYMHERYVFPVLFFLLFAYAANGDRRILLSMLLLTVSTFLNEIVAMYVVSDGAIHAIRGGDIHNRFILLCSMLEVSSAMYCTAALVRRMMNLGKGGKNA